MNIFKSKLKVSKNTNLGLKVFKSKLKIVNLHFKSLLESTLRSCPNLPCPKIKGGNFSQKNERKTEKKKKNKHARVGEKTRNMQVDPTIADSYPIRV